MANVLGPSRKIKCPCPHEHKQTFLEWPQKFLDLETFSYREEVGVSFWFCLSDAQYTEAIANFVTMKQARYRENRCPNGTKTLVLWARLAASIQFRKD